MILSGTQLKEKIQRELIEAVAARPAPPELAIIRVAGDAASEVYVGHKKKFAATLGVVVHDVVCSESGGEAAVMDAISQYNTRQSVQGIIVQIPLPKHYNARRILDTIDPRKDIDALTSTSQALLYNGTPVFIPATTRGILALLREYSIPIAGRHVVVIGRSNLVGKPTALCFLAENATVTIAHSGSRDLDVITRSADIIISAVGKAGCITKDYVRGGQIFIDVGITRTPDGLKGDAGPRVADIVSAITPVPGGVGPLTVAMLFKNLLDAE